VHSTTKFTEAAVSVSGMKLYNNNNIVGLTSARYNAFVSSNLKHPFTVALGLQR
jgi:hypothetical protein